MIGRPKKIVNWLTVNGCLLIQCTDQEVADVCDVDLKTLKAACKRDHKIPFSQYAEQKRNGGRMSLRRRLWSEAMATVMKGRGKKQIEVAANTAALIFACKTMLGLSEHPTPNGSITAKSGDGKAEIVLKWSDEDHSSNAPPNPAPDTSG